MTTRLAAAGGFALDPRTPPNVRSASTYVALGVTAVAVALYLGALLVASPPRSAATVLFAAAPVLAGLGLLVLETRHRDQDDPVLAWVSAGLAVGVVAMVLQLVSFPTVSPSGGPFRTGGESSAVLYLLFHVAPVLGAAAGLAGVGRRWRMPATAAGAVLAVTVAADVWPLPELLRADGSFTDLLVRIEYVAAAATLGVLLVWMRRTGPRADPLRVCVAVSLSLAFYDLVFNALAAVRFSPVWWASLSMRVATYAALAVGGVWIVLRQLREARRYADRELDRRERQLSESLLNTQLLLRIATDLAQTTTLDQIVDIAQECARGALQVDGTGVELWRTIEHRRTTVAPVGSVTRSVEGRPTAWPGIRASLAARGTGLSEPRYLSGSAQVGADLGLDPDASTPETVALLPLRVERASVGTLAVWSHRRLSWSAAERSLLEGLAVQVGQAILRVQATAAQRDAASILQRSLLPGDLPDVVGLTVAARYSPGQDGQLVGGDWYDVIALPQHRVALVVGDVMGKGIRAAAVMGQVRAVVRGAAAVDPSPAAVLEALDEIDLRLDVSEIVTLAYACLDLTTGAMVFARAGHLPPILMRSGAQPVELDDAGSTPLGLPETGRRQATVTLAEGDVLCLFTDGLVERRDQLIDQGLADLADFLDARRSLVVSRPQAALRELFARERSVDDRAALVVVYGGPVTGPVAGRDDALAASPGTSGGG